MLEVGCLVKGQRRVFPRESYFSEQALNQGLPLHFLPLQRSFLMDRVACQRLGHSSFITLLRF